MSKSSEKTHALAIIIPVLNESAGMADLLVYLQACRASAQILIVDGGSTDDTIVQCRQYGLDVVTATKGRASQMNVGAEVSQADIYWFIHADCLPPINAVKTIKEAVGSNHSWGRFDVVLTGSRWIYRLIGLMMNGRSCLTGIATGDQGLFISASLFRQVGGFPDQPLMEDVEISRRLGKLKKPVCLKDKIQVSSRKWQKNGVLRTILLMWALRLRYFFGESPEHLYQDYYGDTLK